MAVEQGKQLLVQNNVLIFGLSVVLTAQWTIWFKQHSTSQENTVELLFNSNDSSYILMIDKILSYSCPASMLYCAAVGHSLVYGL